MRLEVLMFLWEQGVARLEVLIYKICQERWERDLVSDLSGKPRFPLSWLAPVSEFPHSRLLHGISINYKLDNEMPKSTLLLYC